MPQSTSPTQRPFRFWLRLTASVHSRLCVPRRPPARSLTAGPSPMRRPRYCRGNHSPRCQISFSCFRFSFFPPGWLIFLFQYTIPCAEKQNPAFFMVFLSFTHEKQHFMQFCLLDSPQKCYNCINRTSIFFQHPKEVFVCSLIVSLRCVFWVAPSIRGGGIEFTPSGLSAGSGVYSDRRNAHHPCRPGLCKDMAHRGW